MKKKVNIYVILAIAAFFLGSMFPFAYSGVDTGLEQLKVMVDVMSRIQTNYVEETDPKDLVTGALYGMVSRLDDFSEFISAEDMKKMREETRGEFGGVGLRLSTPKEGVLNVITPMPNTPSYKAGIEAGDKVIKIDGKLVSSMTNDEAVSALRGLVGTKVKVEMERTDGKTGKVSTKSYTLKRDRIIPEVIFSKMLPDNIGYIYVTDFSGHTMEGFEKAMKTLTKEGMQALIIDLRFNPGGLLDSAVDMTKLFVGDNKLVVYTKGRKEEFFKEYKSNAKAKYPDLPIVVLVNEGSASGSEIVAGALQDHKRAVLLGARTFGKGSVQQVVMLPDGSGLRLTIAKYYTPLGRMIHRDFKAKGPNTTGGIVPDIVVPFDLNASRKTTYYSTNLIYSPSKKTAVPEIENKNDDIVLNRAVEIIKARDVLSNLTAPAKEEVKSVAAAEQKVEAKKEEAVKPAEKAK